MTDNGRLLQTITPDYIPGTGIQVQLMNLRTIETHLHRNTLEFVYCLRGSINWHVAHEHGTLSAGELITVDQDDIHNFYADEDNLTLIMHVSLENAHIPQNELNNTLFSCTTFLVAAEDIPYIEKVYDTLLAAAYRVASDASCDLLQNTGYSMIPAAGGTAAADTAAGTLSEMQQFRKDCETIRARLLDIMMENFSWLSIKRLGKENIKYKERLQQIVGYVMNNSEKKITTSQLTNIIYLNSAYISSFVHRTPFGSLTYMINYFRCYRAQQMLLETSDPVNEISVRCGFTSEKYFYRYFKEYWQITPLQYRKRLRAFAERKEEFCLYPADEACALLKDVIAEHHVARICRDAGPAVR
jgi:AraC-like DNA-binding protein